jgi:hypothetical protein
MITKSLVPAAIKQPQRKLLSDTFDGPVDNAFFYNQVVFI